MAIIDNTASSISVLAQDDFDALTVTDMGDAISLAQVSEDGDMHDVIIGPDQAEELIKLLTKVLG